MILMPLNFFQFLELFQYFKRIWIEVTEIQATEIYQIYNSNSKSLIRWKFQ